MDRTTVRYKDFEIKALSEDGVLSDMQLGIDHLCAVSFMYWVKPITKTTYLGEYLHTNGKIYNDCMGKKPEEHCGWFHSVESAKRAIDIYYV